MTSGIHERQPEPAACGHEILEHTADLGIRCWGATASEVFEQAAWGLAGVLGVRAEGPGRGRMVVAEATDEAALLVAFLDELLFVHETEDAGFAAIEVQQLSPTEVHARVELVPLEAPPEGVHVKAATYHELRLAVREDGITEARVFLDV